MARENLLSVDCRIRRKEARKRPKILCIDDDPQISEVLQTRLSDFNVELMCAYFGTQGFWLATNEIPDLIITDFRMPQGDGEFVVESLRRNKETSSIPIIVMSGQKGAKFRKIMTQFEVEEYVTKPTSCQELIAIIDRYVPLSKIDFANA